VHDWGDVPLLLSLVVVLLVIGIFLFLLCFESSLMGWSGMSRINLRWYGYLRYIYAI